MTSSQSTSTGQRRRRLVPGWLLLVAFVLVPLVEIYVIIQVGQVIGALWTIVLLIADSILGSWLVKREGGRAWRALVTALHSGRMPARELADGALILAGGLLMLTPGFVLDIVGLLLVLPFTRPAGRRVLAKVIDKRLAQHPMAAYGASVPRPPAGQGPPPNVVKGDVVD